MTNWLTLEEAVQYLNMGKSTLYDLARREKIPTHKMGPGVAIRRGRVG